MITATKTPKKPWAAPNQVTATSSTVKERNKWVVSNMGLARSAAHKWAKLSHVPYEDLESVAFTFLIYASEKFDKTRGVAFSSFALKKISGGILNWIRDKGNVVKIPRSLYDLNQKAKRIERQLEAEYGHKVTSTEVAFAMGIKAQKLQTAKFAMTNCKKIGVEDSLQFKEGGSTCIKALPLYADWGLLSEYEQRCLTLFFSTSTAARLLKISPEQLLFIVYKAIGKVKITVSMAA